MLSCLQPRRPGRRRQRPKVLLAGTLAPPAGCCR